MKKTDLEWEDVIQFEEIEWYGQHVWHNEGKYYFATEEEKRERRRAFILKGLTPLVVTPSSQELFTMEELEELIPIAEEQWIEWRGKLPDNYVSPLENRE